MGTVFWLFGYLSSYLAVLAFAMCIVCGLYFCAEAAEEYPSITKKVIRNALIVVLILHVILWVDGLPLVESAVGLVSHGIYALLLNDFPFIDIFSLKVLLSVAAFIASHYFWFRYFLGKYMEILHIIGFFLIMLWLIPFSLFVSLSVNENILPGIRPPNKSNGVNKNTNVFKALFDSVSSVVKKLAGLTSTISSNGKKRG